MSLVIRDRATKAVLTTIREQGNEQRTADVASRELQRWRENYYLSRSDDNTILELVRDY